jgi:Tol biopolymer transport system component
MTLSRISELFHSALKKISTERRDYLARVKDSATRKEVESLLKQDGRPDSFLTKPPLGAAADMETAAEPAELTGVFGPFRVIRRIGGGGMGHVYRAHDSELGRDVAIKILPAAFQNDPARLARFEREARVLGALNHPNIGTIYRRADINGGPALVLELMDDVLSERLEHGALPLKDALNFAHQIAEALEAAHEKGIVHRDLKPANIALTSDGTVKLLDFGLAKTTTEVVSTGSVGQMGQTMEGTIVGTVAYMSPEQACAQAVDKRTDIWAFGCVLYEMLVGQAVFDGDSAREVISNLLNKEPEWSALPAATPPNVRRLLERCLEKDPRRRLHDIADARLELDDALAGRLLVPQPERKTVSRRWRAAAVVATLLLAGTATAVFFSTRPRVPTAFTELTFQRGRIGGARFASPDGTAVVYSAANEGRPLEVVRVDGLTDHPSSDSPSSRPLNNPAGSDVLAVRAGDLALALRRRFVLGERFVGTLAVAPLGGGIPREMAENIEDADFDALSGQLAVVRSTGDSLGPSEIEFPIGRVLYKTAGSIRFLRVSRDGKRLAFLEDLNGRGVAGYVSVIDIAKGGVSRLTNPWDSVRGMAWSASGNEIWFTAGAARAKRLLRAVDLRGNERVVHEAPGSLTLWDIAENGRVLLSRDEERRSVVAVAPGESAERDLSLSDDSGLSDISDDGKLILAADRSRVYLRGTDGSDPVILLNEAFADTISPDGKAILATMDGGRTLAVVPTGVGSPRPLPKGDVARYRGARWFPNGRRIFFTGDESGKASRTFIQDLDGGPPQPFTPEGARALTVSPLGDLLAVEGRTQGEGREQAESRDRGVTLWSVSDKQSRPLPGSRPGDRPVTWSDDGRSLWVFHRGEVPARVDKLDIATGQRELWKMLVPVDAAGVYSIIEFSITPSGHAYAYGYSRLLSKLFLASELK